MNVEICDEYLLVQSSGVCISLDRDELANENGEDVERLIDDMFVMAAGAWRAEIAGSEPADDRIVADGGERGEDGDSR